VSFQSQLFSSLNFNRVFTWQLAATEIPVSMRFYCTPCSGTSDEVFGWNSLFKNCLGFSFLDFGIRVPTVATATAYCSFVFPSNIFHSSSFQFTKMFIHSHEQFVFGVNLSCVGCRCCCSGCNLLLLFPLSLFFLSLPILQTRFPLPFLFPSLAVSYRITYMYIYAMLDSPNNRSIHKFIFVYQIRGLRLCKVILRG